MEQVSSHGHLITGQSLWVGSQGYAGYTDII